MRGQRLEEGLRGVHALVVEAAEPLLQRREQAEEEPAVERRGGHEDVRAVRKRDGDEGGEVEAQRPRLGADKGEQLGGGLLRVRPCGGRLLELGEQLLDAPLLQLVLRRLAEERLGRARLEGQQRRAPPREEGRRPLEERVACN